MYSFIGSKSGLFLSDLDIGTTALQSKEVGRNVDFRCYETKKTGSIENDAGNCSLGAPRNTKDVKLRKCQNASFACSPVKSI